MARQFAALKAFYYLDHFHEAIEEVERHYGAILGEEERGYLGTFRSLPKEAQAVLVRMANRRGLCFATAGFKYAEISDLARCLSLLKEEGLLRIATREEILGVLTKPELLKLFSVEVVKERRLRSLKKGDLQELAVARQRSLDFGMMDECGYVALDRSDTLAFIRFLFFGKGERNLKAFALRDLGLLGKQKDGRETGPRFATREIAYGVFRFQRLSEEISLADGNQLKVLAERVGSWPSGSQRLLRKARSSALCSLGRKLERAGELETAMGVYEKAEEHPCRERLVRLLYQSNRKEEAGAFLKEILRSPWTDEELLFAEDFYARKFEKVKLSRLTKVLRAAPAIKVDESFRDQAERAAIRQFAGEGKEAYWTENHLWRLLFGLIFWPELQEDPRGKVASQFDALPISLKNGTFYQDFEESIQAKLDLVRRGKVLDHCLEIFTSHFGEMNGMFRWRKGDLGMIQKFFAVVSPEALANHLEFMARQSRVGSGYPDLMVIEEDGIRFVEVKAEGDQLQRHQLAKLAALEKAGFEVGVLRVLWQFDPNQEYVVVDIETTGGRSASHRVTEIGAVKVKGNRVTETYQTLLNPERRIPRNITALTGIHDEMVRRAPKFAEVAEDFREFLGEAVFVAHSVNFDYGFLKAEFERLGERLRCPTLCTVVSMRKFFPGLKSYSLGNLCREFEITLENHHRALDDAKATSELLRMINEKRAQTGYEDHRLSSD